MTTWDGAAKTWGTENVTSTLLNDELRDPLLSIGGSWNLYTPTWAASTTSPTVGNANLEGRYIQAGKLIIFNVVIAVGSTTSLGTGNYTVSLPVQASTSPRQLVMVELFDNSTGVVRGFGRIATSGTVVDLYCPGTTAGGYDRTVTQLIPFTFAVNDQIVISGTYEAA